MEQVKHKSHHSAEHSFHHISRDFYCIQPSNQYYRTFLLRGGIGGGVGVWIIDDCWELWPATIVDYPSWLYFLIQGPTVDVWFQTLDKMPNFREWNLTGSWCFRVEEERVGALNHRRKEWSPGLKGILVIQFLAHLFNVEKKFGDID